METENILKKIELTDYISIVRDGCYRRILFSDFLKVIVLGGYSACESWLNCVEGIGDPDEGIIEIPIDTPPTMSDLFIQLNNRQQNRFFSSDEFLTKYYDAENNTFKKIIITGGDLSGYYYNEVPIYIGLVIYADELSELKYDAKNTDSSYQQELWFDAYDENNVKAVKK